MRITTLIENTTTRGDLAAEHGLSLFIETDRHKILFDAGQSGAFADNARTLGIDLSCVDLAVLSHGHYDHSGGMLRFLDINGAAPLYINAHAFAPHYNGTTKYIGIDPALRQSSRIVVTGDHCELDEQTRLLTCNGLPQPYPADAFGLTLLENGNFRPDPFHHEQYLLIRENGKTVLFSGCSHKGILNIVHWLKPHVLVGGFHFSKLDPNGNILLEAAKTLMEHNTAYYTGHCTGSAQFAALKARMGSNLSAISTGNVIEI